MSCVASSALRAAVGLPLRLVTACLLAACGSEPGATAATAPDDVAPPGRLQPLLPPFAPQGGFAFHAPLAVDWPSDTPGARDSRLLVYEDGQRLGPAHALHHAIRERGGGAYSHWSDGLWFSSSDGSDPNDNGRLYAIAWSGGDGLGEDRWRPLPRELPFARFAGGQPPAVDGTTVGAEPPGAPRTIWFHVIDALRADTPDARVNGHPVMPALAAFAAESVRFDVAYACSGFTKTSTASLFTGLWPQRHGVLHGVLPLWPRGVSLVHGLDARFETLAALLARRGWDTRSHPYTVHARPGDGLLTGFAQLDLVPGATPPFPVPPRPEARLFAYEHLLGVHAPYRPDPATRAALGLPAPARLDPGATEWFHRELDADEIAELHADYLALARQADGIFARRLRWLRESGRFADTLLIVTADHGEAFGEHGTLQHASALFEENVRVPLFVRFPEGSPYAALHGQRFEHRVSLADLLPTLLELLGAPPPGYALDGKSLLPILRGEESDVFGREVSLRGSFTETAADGSTRLFVQDALLSGPHKALFGHRLQSARTGTESFALGDWLARLHDLRTDPGERHDDSAHESALFLRLLARHAALSAPLRAPGAPVPADAADADAVAPDADEEALRALGYVR